MFAIRPCTYPSNLTSPIPGKPFLRFFAPPADTGTGGQKTESNPDEFLPGDAELDDAAFAAKRGFPRGTARDTMTGEQREAYYRYESKKQQHLAEAAKREAAEWAKLGNREDIATALTKQEQDRFAALGDSERAVETAKATAKAEGLQEGRDLYLTAAVEGQILAVARGADETPDAALERVRAALKYIDVSKFIGTDGALNVAELHTYAASLAPTGAAAPSTPAGDPLSGMLNRQAAPTPGAGGSLAELRKAEYEKRRPPQQ